MHTVSISDARKRLSQLVLAAERGESVVLTRRGKAVACIVPVEKKPLRRLPDLSAFRASIKIKGKSLSRTLLDMRAEERY